MWGLFIVALVFIYCIGVRILDRSERVGTTKDSKVLENRQLETELARKIKTPENQEHILELIKDDLVYVYGAEWEKHFKQRWSTNGNYVEPSFKSPENIAHLLLLSKSGVACSWLNSSNLHLVNYSHANAYQCLRIMQCVEKNIREKRNDPKLKLYFYPGFDYEGTGKKRKAVPNYKHLYFGRWCWNFELNYDEMKYAKSLSDNGLITRCAEIADPDFEQRNNPYKDTFVL